MSWGLLGQNGLPAALGHGLPRPADAHKGDVDCAGWLSWAFLQEVDERAQIAK
jgi:hypothetical protein